MDTGHYLRKDHTVAHGASDRQQLVDGLDALVAKLRDEDAAWPEPDRRRVNELTWDLLLLVGERAASRHSMDD